MIGAMRPYLVTALIYQPPHPWGASDGPGMTYLDVWRIGTFLLYSCKAAFYIQETSPRLSDVEHSVVLPSVFAIGSALTYLLFSGNVPLLHTSRYVIPRDSVLPGPALVLQATNAGARSRRPGYEAKLAS